MGLDYQAAISVQETRIDGGTNGPVTAPLKNITRCQPSPDGLAPNLGLRVSFVIHTLRPSLRPERSQPNRFEMKITTGFTSSYCGRARDSSGQGWWNEAGNDGTESCLPQLGSTFQQEHDRRDGKSYFKWRGDSNLWRERDRGPMWYNVLGVSVDFQGPSTYADIPS